MCVFVVVRPRSSSSERCVWGTRPEAAVACAVRCTSTYACVACCNHDICEVTAWSLSLVLPSTWSTWSAA
eukprot:4598523-Prymnesium_polylepis.2